MHPEMTREDLVEAIEEEQVKQTNRVLRWIISTRAPSGDITYPSVARIGVYAAIDYVLHKGILGPTQLVY